MAQATQGKLVVIDDADYGMEIEGSVRRTIQALKQVMAAIEEFITLAD